MYRAPHQGAHHDFPFTSPSPTPTPPAFGLIILEPADGSTSADRTIIIRGLAQPNATITRDVPLWFDEHKVADGSGRWSFVESLNPGENKFTFRVGDDISTAVTLTVAPAPTFDYTLSAAPPTISAPQGGTSTASTITPGRSIATASTRLPGTSAVTR